MFSGWYDRTKRSPAQWNRGIVTAQIAWELEELIAIFDELKPTRVLEIGSQWGGTLWHWLEGCERGARVMNIDILQNMSREDAKALPDRWQSWCPDGVLLNTYIGRSDMPDTIAAVKEWMPEIDFLFIDACHEYNGAKRDFLTYGPLVRPGGVIALHDLMTPEFSPHIQVWQLWREIQAAGYKTQELRANDDAAYGGIGVVYV